MCLLLYLGVCIYVFVTLVYLNKLVNVYNPHSLINVQMMCHVIGQNIASILQYQMLLVIKIQ